MNKKSFVSLEQKACFVCLKPYDTGTVLLNTRLCDTLEHHTLTGLGELCPDCAKKKREGYVALIGARHAETLEGRTGDVMHMREDAFKAMFDIPIPEKRVCYVEPELVEHLKKLAEKSLTK